MTDLLAILRDTARPEAVLHLPGRPETRVELAELIDRAARTATRVRRELGGKPRRLGLLMVNSEAWVRGLLTAWTLGATAVPLPLPVAFAGMEAYAEHLGRIARDGELDALLVSDGTGARLLDQVRRQVEPTALIDITAPDHGERPLPPAPPAELAVIQYTSGSTSRPKGVMLSHANVAAGLRAITESVAWRDGDRLGLWLPLFHDMGLFGLLTALVNGAPAHLYQPRDFVRRPLEWLADFAATGATITPAPNFFYDLLVGAAHQKGVPDGLDLSRWRFATNGAEPVQRRTMDLFARTFAPYGLRENVVQPTYGMAEATLMVTCPKAGSPVRSLEVDRTTLGVGDRIALRDTAGEGTRTVVSCGRPVSSVDLRIADPDGAEVRAGTVGEVQISGPAVTRGYLGLPTDQQPITGDGWVRTGDLGFLHDGELYVMGRLKDMVIVNGQNHYAEDAEYVARSTPGVDGRRCAAFAWQDAAGERMVVIWEARDGAAAEAVSEEVRLRLARQLGLGAIEVVAVPAATIPFTSSGKVKRQAALALWQENVTARTGHTADPIEHTTDRLGVAERTK
ncbi:AMP-binding protein [Streptomyces sp. FH025]|uniref:AMP-binding protein n=1 Tax=Streptomyces sp. FH025 TaxID=2815937 RepID=UPI001A9DC477|nr:AMP-binding protein [Streptomyces sp. FH025]MBO1414774.1 AMP-binding protein [Streptomyces sp. FH025]